MATKSALKKLLAVGLSLLIMGGAASCSFDEDIFTNNIFPNNTTFQVGNATSPYNAGYFNTVYADTIILDSSKDDLRTPVSAVKVPGVNAPDEVVFQGGLILGFDDKAAPLEQIGYFVVQLPHEWTEGTDIEPHIHWVSDGSGGNVVWTLTYSWANMGAVFPAASTLSVTGAAGSVANLQLVTSYGNISGAGKTHSSMIVCSLKRSSSNVADTYAGSALLLEFDFHYKKSFYTEDEG